MSYSSISSSASPGTSDVPDVNVPYTEGSSLKFRNKGRLLGGERDVEEEEEDEEEDEDDEHSAPE